MLEALFSPSSIALVGATERSNIFRGILRSLEVNGYAGPIYPINPRYTEVFERPCFPAIGQTPSTPGLAIIAIPASATPAMLEDCANASVPAAHVCATGFAEAGPDGRALFQQLREVATRRGILLLGPGSFGYIATKERCAPFWGGPADRAMAGNVGLVAQSGGFANLFAFLSQQRGFGFSYLVASGSEATLTGADYLSFMADDPHTRVLVGILEEIKNVPLLANVADRAAASGKPLVLLKVGRSARGGRAAAAHSGSLAGDYAFHEAFCKQKGIIVVDNLDDLQETVVLLSAWGERLPKGPATGIITVSGGDCVLMGDLAAEVGLPLPELEPERQRRITTMVPDTMMPFNPVDTGVTPMAKPGLLTELLVTVAEDEAVQIAAARITGGLERFQELADARHRTPKPVVLFTRASEAIAPPIRRAANEAGVPLLFEIERTFRALRQVGEYAVFRDAPSANRQVAVIPARKEAAIRLLSGFSGSLPEEAGLDLLDLYGIPTPRRQRVTSADEAAEAAMAIGCPVAVKISSPDIIHKTDAGGVRIGLRDQREVRQAFEHVTAAARQYRPNARIDGVLVEEMVQAPVELYLGLKTDDHFGAGVLFGFGGVLVELLRLTSLRIAPLTERDAEAMIDERLHAELFQGFRGQAALDRDSLVQAIVAFGDLSWELADKLAAIDVNPLLLGGSGEGVRAVDCAVVLRG